MSNSRGSLFRRLYIAALVIAVVSSLAKLFIGSSASVLGLPLLLIFPAMMFLAGYYWTAPDLSPEVRRILWALGGFMGFTALVLFLAIVPTALILHPHRNWRTITELLVFFSLFPIGYIFGRRKHRRSPAVPGPQDR